MNDYLTKPTPLARLQSVLDKWLAPGPLASMAVSSKHPQVAAPADHSLPVDIGILAEFVDNDLHEMEALLANFRVSAQRTAADLHSAHRAGQTSEVAALAHQLKSSSRWVGALVLGELCAAIEEAGHIGRSGPLEELIARFDSELSRVDRYIAQRQPQA